MGNCFDIINTPLSLLKLIKRKPIGDHRGYLERFFCKEELQAIIPGKNILQINHTLTIERGTIRGMHFQYPPYAEIKFVSCIRGEIFDVAIDLRQHSPTFLKYHTEILSENNYKTLCIPEGFAHGFQTLSDHCELLYFHTNVYHPQAEGGINALDQQIAIPWPLPIQNRSGRDLSFPTLDSNFQGIAL